MEGVYLQVVLAWAWLPSVAGMVEVSGLSSTFLRPTVLLTITSYVVLVGKVLACLCVFKYWLPSLDRQASIEWPNCH